MKRLARLATLLGPLIGLSACAAPQADSNPLAWLETANAEQDARAALAKNDFRLLALPRRETVIPGIEPQLARQYELKCGIRLIPGAGDAVRDRQQLELLKKAARYAADYNAIIKTRCRL